MATLTNGVRSFYDLPLEDAKAMAKMWNEGIGSVEWEVIS